MGYLFRITLGLLTMGVLLGLFVLFHPSSPLPRALHPLKPLAISDPVNFWTQMKLSRALTGQACFDALSTGAQYVRLTDRQDSEQCFIRDRLELTGLNDVSIAPIETRCATALRLAMWVEHGIKPAADRILLRAPSRVHHASSYNCRRIRTSAGIGQRMSSHATADAIDITGVTLEDGTRLNLVSHWDGDAPYARFFHAARDSACKWFRVTLGPNYNSLHKDHFHLQHTGWGVCR